MYYIFLKSEKTRRKIERCVLYVNKYLYYNVYKYLGLGGSRNIQKITEYTNILSQRMN